VERVGYCANAAGTAARQKASNPNPRRITAGGMNSFWLLDIVNGSFFIDPQVKCSGQIRAVAQSSAA
jgi:hypothetical protein